VVQSLFGGLDPGFESVPVPVLGSDQHDPSRLREQSPQIAVTAPRDRSQDRAISGRDLLGHQSEPGAEVATLGEYRTVADRWHLTIISGETVLFSTTTRSRQEAEDLAAEARRLRPDVEIVIHPAVGAAYRYE
jgi:hypothetical protein